MTRGAEAYAAADLDGPGPLIMGVLNVTPDSFSDGGQWNGRERALEQAQRMIAEGASIIDVGGESSRPGAEPVSVAEELQRVLPVIEALAPICTVSVDTAKPEVAHAALQAGARILNDITASQEEVAAQHGAGWIAMHMQGNPQTMQNDPNYDDVVGEVAHFLAEAEDRGRTAGVESVWVDPGIGFGKTTAHNLRLLQETHRLATVGAKLVIGASRKRFIGQLHATSDGVEQVGPGDRLPGSVLAAGWAARAGAHIIRVHDVHATARVVKLLARTNDYERHDQETADDHGQ